MQLYQFVFTQEKEFGFLNNKSFDSFYIFFENGHFKMSDKY